MGPLFEEALYARLTGTIVDSVVDGRIYPLEIPQQGPGEDGSGDSFPCIVYQIISEAPVNSKDGASAAYQRRVQFDCYGHKVFEAISVAASLLEELEGTARTITVEGRSVKLRSIHLLNTTDNLEQSARVKRRSVDIAITFVPARIVDPQPEGS